MARPFGLTFKFCATGKTGLGHLRRITNVAKDIARIEPAADLRLFTNAPVAGLDESERRLFRTIEIASREQLADALGNAPPGPVVVDTAVIPGIEALGDPLCLILRETVGNRLTSFRLPNARKWEIALIPNPSSHWCPSPGDTGARQVLPVGWIYRQAALRETPPSRTSGCPEQDDQRRILVASGGGGSPETAAMVKSTVDTLVETLRKTAQFPFTVEQVIGPRAGEASRLSTCDCVLLAGPRLHQAFAEADLVISTVGYNSVLELACLDVPAVLLAIPRTFDDQAARATRWGPQLGIAYDAANSGRTVEWMRRVLEQRTRRAPVDLGPSGAAACAEALLAIARGAGVAQYGAKVTKHYGHRSSVTAACAARRSNYLAHAGLRTPRATSDDEAQTTTSPRVHGPCARNEMERSDVATDAGAFVAQRELFTRILEPVARLHALTPGTDPDWNILDIRPFDPWRRINARIEPHGMEACGLSERQKIELRRCTPAAVQALRATRRGRARRCGLVHGDFHAGQVLLPHDGSGAWLIDLDDLAIGEPEADLANFAAHIVTTTELYCGPLSSGFAGLTRLLREIYEALSGRVINPELLKAFGAIALLRRAAKLAGANRNSPAFDDILSAYRALLCVSGAPHDLPRKHAGSRRPVAATPPALISPDVHPNAYAIGSLPAHGIEK